MAMNKTFWPMFATWTRIILVPAIIVLILTRPQGWNYWSGILFILASLTDWLDGYLARKLQATSDLGKFLDPIADKVLVSSVLILLISLQRIDALAVILILNRDILVGGLRSFAASRGMIIAADRLGKWKTAIQMIAIPLSLFGGSWYDLDLATLGYYGIWASVILSLISGAQYCVRFVLKNSTAT